MTMEMEGCNINDRSEIGDWVRTSGLVRAEAGCVVCMVIGELVRCVCTAAVFVCGALRCVR